MSFARALILVTLLAPAGCYRWVPHDGGPAVPGTDLRVRLTDAGSDELRRVHGDNDGSFSGPMAAWNDERISLVTETVLRRPGFPATVMSDTVPIPRMWISGVDVKELDGKKTALFSAGVVGAAGLLVWATRAFTGSSETNEGGGTIPEALMLFRIPLGLGVGSGR